MCEHVGADDSRMLLVTSLRGINRWHGWREIEREKLGLWADMDNDLGLFEC